MFSGRSQISLFVLSFSKVLVHWFISSSLLWDLWPSVAKKSHSIKLSLSLPVSDYNGLLIFNYPMPTPCLAKDQKKKTSSSCKTHVRLLASLFVLKFLHDYIARKAWLSFLNARRFVIYSWLALDLLQFFSVDFLLVKLFVIMHNTRLCLKLS